MDKFLELLNTYKDRAIRRSNYSAYGDNRDMMNAITDDFDNAEAALLAYAKSNLKEENPELSPVVDIQDKNLVEFLATKFHDTSEYSGTKWEECDKWVKNQSYRKVDTVVTWIEQFENQKKED